jgi:hypothetical protein
MASFNKINQFVADAANKVHNLSADDLRIYLSNTAATAGSTVYNTPADLVTSGGYTAGGATCAITSSTQSGGLYKLIITGPSWTATTGFGPFEFAILYNNTAASKQLIGYWDYGSSLSVAASATFSITLDASNGTVELQ